MTHNGLPADETLMSGRFSLGVEIPQQPMHAETSDDEKHREIRQVKNSVAPQVDLLARADGQAVDDERRCCGCIAIDWAWL
jgi:hypothetical protein